MNASTSKAGFDASIFEEDTTTALPVELFTCWLTKAGESKPGTWRATLNGGGEGAKEDSKGVRAEAFDELEVRLDVVKFD